MAILGTKKFWIPSSNNITQQESQILKNSGYINLQVHCVNYMSKGNFWQNTFGGRDKIALTTSLKYQSGVDSIEATSVQDVREVKVNRNYNLGLQSNIAVKIPANADAISIEVKMTAVKDDQLQAKFDMLNQDDYRSALQLAPILVGQVLTVTSLVKKLFSDSDPNTQLEASYAGIISSQREVTPVYNGKLTEGLIIMISTDEGDQFNDVDETDFELRGDTLYYKNRQIENTYIVFKVSFEALKGDNENSNWFKKYNEALNNLDKIYVTENDDEISKIYKDSKEMWIQGNALIDVDVSYINSERMKIKNLAFQTIRKKYSTLTQSNIAFQNPTEIIGGITGSTSFDVVNTALPKFGNFINSRIKIETSKPVNLLSFEETSINNDDLLSILDDENNDYINELESIKIPLRLKNLK